MSNLQDCSYDYRHENPQARKIHTCTVCGYGIYNGDTYYEVHENPICEECMEDMKKEAEVEE